MYFESRAVAGAKLASDLIDAYRYEDTSVLALDNGGVAVGYQIAIYLHTTLQRLLSETISIQDESIDYATIMEGGVVAKNPELSESEGEYYYAEYQGKLDDEMREANEKMNRLVGDGGDIDPKALKARNIILVSDGLCSGTILDATMEWLKPIGAKKVVLAVPVMSIAALDKAHILVDELHILSVTPNYISTDHYYDSDDSPNSEMVKNMINRTILGWK